MLAHTPTSEHWEEVSPMIDTDVQAAGKRPPPPPLDLARAAGAAHGAAGQLVALLRAGADPGVTAVGRWTVRDVAAHVASGAELYARMVGGTPSPAPTIEAITALNDEIMGTLADEDLLALADHIEAAVDSLLAAAERHPADQDVPWHAGLHLPLPTLLAVACGEYLVHGNDIARSPGAPRGRCRPTGPGRCSSECCPSSRITCSPRRHGGGRPGTTSGCAASAVCGRSSPSPMGRWPSKRRRPAGAQTVICPRTRGHSCSCSTAAAGPSGPPSRAGSWPGDAGHGWPYAAELFRKP